MKHKAATAENKFELLPEWGRASDVQRHFAIRRGQLYSWLKERRVQSISLREPGKRTGTRLFYLPGIRAMLMKLLAEQNGEVAS